MLILTPLLKINQSLKVFLGKIFSSSENVPVVNSAPTFHFPSSVITSDEAEPRKFTRNCEELRGEMR